MRIAKADLVPTSANLRDAYASFAELEAACAAFCLEVNTRPHRITRRPPADMLAEERARLHPLPAHPYTAAFGVTRAVPANTPMVSFETGSYSVPHQLVGQSVWVRRHGEQVVVVHVGPAGPVEVARHRRTGPGSPRVDDAHFPPAAGDLAAPHPAGPHRGGDGVPGPRRRGGAVADRGRAPPAPAGSGPRWPRRSAWPSWWAPHRSAGRSGTPRSPAASPRATWPRSWPTRPAAGPGRPTPPGRTARCPRAPAAGPTWAPPEDPQ